MALPKIEDIVDGLLTNRAEFGLFFLQAQHRAGLAPANRRPFELVASEADDKAAFHTALAAANTGNYLKHFLLIALEEKRVTGGLRLRAARAMRKDPELQAVVDKDGEWEQAALTRAGMGAGMQVTARIKVGIDTQGTGVLVESDKVLTAWHVVRTLFERTKSGGLRPRKGSHEELVVEFDDVVGYENFKPVPAKVRRIRVHPDWCLAFSPAHEDELLEKIPKPLSALAGHNDYVLIRLAVRMADRPVTPLEANAIVPRPKDPLIVFQHPLKMSLVYARGTVSRSPAGLAGIRFLHCARTKDGSSGAPCYDRNFTLIGLHQGVWKQPGRKTVLNRGIPITTVYENLNRKRAPIDDVAPATGRWRLSKENNYSPIFGLKEFQKLLAQAAEKGIPRVIVIAGTEGAGKTFCIRVLQDSLSVAGHLVVPLPAGLMAKEEARAVAARIASTASAPLEAIDPPATYASTSSAWLRDEVVSSLVVGLDTARGGRAVWLCFEDLNDYRLEGELASELLLLLCEEAKGNDWLHIVLDGATGDLPASIAELGARHELRPIRRNDVLEYLEQAFAELNLQVQNRDLAPKLRSLMTEFEQLRMVSPSSALARLSLRVQELIAELLAEHGGSNGQP